MLRKKLNSADLACERVSDHRSFCGATHMWLRSALTLWQVPQAGRRIPSLDGLRAISISLVMISHLYGTRGFPITGAAILATYAAFGVRVFFVISGFLITSILLVEHDRTGKIDLRKFYIRRAYRILPPAYVYIAAVSILFGARMTYGDIARAVTYLTNWNTGSGSWYLGHLWSLSVEEQFYLLWPWLLAALFALRFRIAVLAIAIAPLVRLVLFQHGLEDAASRYFPAVCDALSSGCLLAIVRPRLLRYSRILSSKWMLAPITLTGLLPLLYRHPHVYNGLVVTAMNLGIVLAVDHTVRCEYKILNVAPVVVFGTLSYSLYLWQQPFLNKDVSSVWTAFPLNVLLAFVAAILSFLLVEQPALRMRERREARLVLSTPTLVQSSATSD
jgi:peptidoglycan/LPS O-acetylase OafA/YrhL